MSGAEDTGNESKEGFRNWKLWRAFTAVSYTMLNKDQFVDEESMLLFILTGNNDTNMALISGFGLHGGIFKDIDIRYIMPYNLFNVPIIRELLVWSGAIRAHKDVNGSILNLLRKGKSVAYYPQTTDDGPILDKGLFEFAIQNKIKLVPVVINGEQARYSIYRPALIKAVQRFFVKRLGYPFPLIFCPKIFGQSPPPKVDISIGVPMEPSIQQSSDSFYGLFHAQIKSLTIL